MGKGLMVVLWIIGFFIMISFSTFVSYSDSVINKFGPGVSVGVYIVGLILINIAAISLTKPRIR